MPKIQRKTQKVFCNSADSDQLAVFGSMSTGTPVYTSDVEELQSNEAFDLGWDAATLEDKAPFMEEMNGVQYGLTYQIAYGLQEGIPEYDSATTYYIGSICKVLEDGKPILYTSLTDDNIGNAPANDSTNWERLSFGGGGLEIGDVGFTQMAIDETKGKRRVLNGQLIIQDQYMQLTNIIKASVALNPDLACTEAEWQTALTMSTNGVCYKYVIDDEAGTIRLPKYPEYLDLSINGAKTVSVYGNGKAIGLTANKDGGLAGANTDALYARVEALGLNVDTTLSGSSGIVSGNNNAVGLIKDPTKSGIVGSVTTSSELIKGTYYIQVATGAETEDNVTNEFELLNPYSLLDYKWSEYELDNSSWLRSEGQYNYKSTHPTAYDLLLKIYNGTETKAGVSVKLTSETFTDYDFVLNTADETFRLPIKVKLASGKAVVGNGNAMIWNDTVRNYGMKFNTSGDSNRASYFTTDVPVAVGTEMNTAGAGTYNLAMGLSQDSSMSGVETSDSDLYLYFYVGAVAQNAPIVNLGRIQETYTTKSMVDGQWVNRFETLASSLSMGHQVVKTFDLSNILPNDGYNYEVMFTITAFTGSTNGNCVEIAAQSDILKGGNRVAQTITRTSATMQTSASFILPVGGQRLIQVWQIHNSTCTLSFLRTFGYRRIGTNL